MKMSFKDVRDFSEHLKLLGYANVFPLQPFASNSGTLASFCIVAGIVKWLVDLLEPGTQLSGGTENEEQRVLFIHSTIEFFITKAAIKLNPRKLYAASRLAILELRKITSMLIAPRQSADDDDLEEQNYRSFNQIDISDKMDNLRLSRELSADLTKRGVNLYELLTKEMANKTQRQNEMNKNLDMSAVERLLKIAISSTQKNLQTLHAQLENSKLELNALTSKFQRKSAELDRTKQRLEALSKIRPAHIQELTECEKELGMLFQQYFLRVHVRDALNDQLEERANRLLRSISPLVAQKSVEASSVPFMLQDNDNNMQAEFRMANEELLQGQFDIDSELSDIRDEDIGQSDLVRHDGRTSVPNTLRRPGSAVQSKRNLNSAQLANTGRQVAHNSYWNRDRDNDDSSLSSDSEIDMSELINSKQELNLLDNNQDSFALKVDDSDLNSIDDISISKIPAELPMRPKTANKQEHHSDEDF